ncbi:hypothetical protein H9Q74_009725 [Fusarium xylarioides]|nr:hypothetical protein H9Q71_009874 [Fusarium xylarioides]KAG5819007.1 hypothetical protein H9Q74_009725 [Fusarium xylarioides]
MSKICHSEGPSGQAMGNLVRTNPKDSDGCYYSLSVFAGPEKLRNTLDSIIQANRDSIMESVRQQIGELGHSQIKDISADRLECSFAAVSKQGQTASWNVDLILNFHGTVRIDPSWWAPDSNAKLSNLAVQLGFRIDTTKSSEDNKQVPQIYFHRVQLSCDEISSYLRPILESKMDLPAWNSTKSKGLLDNINAKLNDSLSKLGDLAKLGPMEQYNLSTIPQTPPSYSNHREWMSTPDIQCKQLGQLKIPGTHNSAAYKFDTIISPMLEQGVDKLRNLRTGTAPLNHRLDDTENIYIGKLTLKRQLEEGIRFLDLRIYREEDGEYYNQHFLRGPTLDELLDQVRQFLEEHDSSSEFIIVELAQCNYGGEHGTQVADKIKNKLERWLYMPSDAKTHSGRYDFQTLHNITLESITNGRPKVLFVSRTSWLEYPHSVLNVEDKTLENPGNGSPLFPRWFTKVPTNGEEVAYILLNTFDPDARIKNLRHRAYEHNAEVSKVLSQKNTPWRYMMDWYTDCKGVEKSEDLPVERIIQANK